MIAKIKGQIDGLSNRGVYVQVGGLVYEVLLTAKERQEIELRELGEDIALHTLYFLEGGVGGGNQSPILVGFQKAQHREFFELLIRVEGIGIGSALRMLSIPIHQVARAIEENNLPLLCTLKQVGERTARKIVANLMGKVEAFAFEVADIPPAGTEGQKISEDLSPNSDQETALNEEPEKVFKVDPLVQQEKIRAEVSMILEQLGYSSSEVKKMLAQAFMQGRVYTEAEEVLDVIYQR